MVIVSADRGGQHIPQPYGFLLPLRDLAPDRGLGGERRARWGGGGGGAGGRGAGGRGGPKPSASRRDSSGSSAGGSGASAGGGAAAPGRGRPVPAFPAGPSPRMGVS